MMKRVKGFGEGRKKLIKHAKTADTKAGAHSYRDRRVKKRSMRQLWQIRINAAVRAVGMSYSHFMGELHKKGILLDRKVLSQIAASHPEVFKKIAELAK